MAPVETPSRPEFEVLFNASPNAYVLLDADLRIVEANKAYLQVTGRSREDILGEPLLEAFPGDASENRERLKASFERVLATGERDSLALIPYRVSKDTTESDGETRYWSATHTPILDENGDVAFILQHTTDVTDLYEQGVIDDEAHSDELSAVDDSLVAEPTPGEEKEEGSSPQVPAEKKLTPQQIEEGILSRAESVQKAYWASEEEREHLRRLFDQAPGFMVFQRGPEHVYELANQAYFDLIGRRDIIGKPVREALPDLEGQGFFELLDRVYETGEPFVGREVEVRVQREPGKELEPVYVDFIYQPIIEPDGSVSGIFTQGHDVTEKKLTKDRLRQRKAELQELTETLEERVEQRTQQVRDLTSKVTMAEQRERERIARLLHDDLQQQFYGIQLKMSSFRDKVQAFERGLQQDDARVSSSLELAHEAGEMERHMERAIQAMRTLSVGMSPPVLRSEGLTAALEWLQTHMKETQGIDVQLSADAEFRVEEEMRVLLFQVTQALLRNVAEHAGVDQATVDLYQQDDDVLVIQVSDEGIGFDPEALGEKRPDEAFGLTAARERVRLFGGELSVDSAPGAGTEVTVRVPLETYSGLAA